MGIRQQSSLRLYVNENHTARTECVVRSQAIVLGMIDREGIDVEMMLSRTVAYVFDLENLP